MVEDVNKLTKLALKGDEKSLYDLLSFLEQYNVPVAKFGEYSIVFQLAMNKIIDTSRECEVCGGKCCKSGLSVPVYEFDYEEMSRNIHNLRLEKSGNIYILPRPCPFLKGWACGIHKFKPYACLSYPFATEDEQIEVIKRYNGNGIPDFHIPEFCLAGKKVKDIISQLVQEFKKRNGGRDPSPRELYEELKKLKLT